MGNQFKHKIALGVSNQQSAFSIQPMNRLQAQKVLGEEDVRRLNADC